MLYTHVQPIMIGSNANYLYCCRYHGDIMVGDVLGPLYCYAPLALTTVWFG